MGDLSDPDFYVSVNEDIVYKCNTILRAIDITFKIYMTVEAPYPPDAVLPWTFLQKYIYRLDSPKKNFTSVLGVASELGLTKKKQ